jgi:hypothetical protein
MKVAFMGELDSAIAEWVSKTEKHGRDFIYQEFRNKGYPFDDIVKSVNSLLNQGVLEINDGYLTLKDIEDDAPEVEQAPQHVVTPLSLFAETRGGITTKIIERPRDGFDTQVLDHISDETRAHEAVPDYIKTVLAEGAKAFLGKSQADYPTDKNPAVHSPAHYTRGGIETIDFIEAKGLNFHLGNTVKYVSRAGYKQDALLQDLEKALWYLTREIDRLKKQEP